MSAAGEREVVPVIEEAVAAKEAERRAAIRGEDRRLLGRRAVLAQWITDGPRTREPRRRLSPRVASRNKWAWIEALQRCKQFAVDYREAWRRWCAGLRDVVFPAGTWSLHFHAPTTFGRDLPKVPSQLVHGQSLPLRQAPRVEPSG